MATSTETKKKIERRYLERFIALFSDFPVGEIEPSEEPDFLIHRDSVIVGIELTELHQAAVPGTQSLQANQAMRQRVVARAQELYEQTGLPSVRTSLFFSPHNKPIQKPEVEPLARAICNLISKNVPAQNGSYEERYDWENRKYFPETLDLVRVRRLPQITETHFNSPGSTWVSNLSATDINRVLIAKEAKYFAYRKRCNEVWLLINTDLGSMSTWFQYESSSLQQTFITNFDRVFLLRHFANQVYELNIQKPTL